MRNGFRPSVCQKGFSLCLTQRPKQSGQLPNEDLKSLDRGWLVSHGGHANGLMATDFLDLGA